MPTFICPDFNGETISLGLFEPGQTAPTRTVEMVKKGAVWTIDLQVSFEGEYAFLLGGKDWISPPYAHSLNGQRGELFSLEDSQKKFTPHMPKDLIIYEMHVKGFTAHPSSKVEHPGTYLGVIEKIPYLKDLGITAVELLPIFDFSQTYWGYCPDHFFAPTKRYATTQNPGGAFHECKEMIQALHQAGIAVILDVVYNHTGKHAELPPHFYFPQQDYTGCGNTLNTNLSPVQDFILDSLRFWAEEMQVDGFRFDLASVFCRDEKGNPDATPPIIEAINRDPLLQKCLLIAEPWDCAGLYQVGSFPGGWKEWNGSFRDVARARVNFDAKDPLPDREKDINFITAHDGFTLLDLVSYSKKHNEQNGENNRDGSDYNISDNCGTEGPTDDPHILAERERRMRAFLSLLFESKGIPMLLMGDEYGHSRRGNNNPYNQDNALNYFDWNFSNEQKMRHAFTKSLIAKRRNFAR